jgi:APA family basic amino acid/polyamine antiporter
MTGLKRQLGLAAVMAVVMGDMLGSGIFFTPGELARVADSPWQVYFIWSLCGLIVLGGALTLGELASLIPRAGATYHILRESFGPAWGFVKAWMETWVAAPGSIAGVAIVFGEFVVQFLGDDVGSTQLWGIVAVAFFAGINLMGVQWGGRAQVILTAVKVAGLLLLVGGSYLLADAVAPAEGGAGGSTDLGALLRFVGLGVAAVFFTYDGWVDVSHVAGEVEHPKRTLPLGLGFGVLGIMVLYLIVNHAFLRIMPLSIMRDEGATVATRLASVTFGDAGGQAVSTFIMISIFGALGGLVMTAPRIVYAFSSQYRDSRPLRALSYVSPKTSVPAAAIVFSAILSMIAILFFQTFDRMVSFILVPLQLANVATVAAVFRLRKRALEKPDQYLTPGYPVVPLLFIVVMTLLMVNAAIYNPLDTFIGVGLTALGFPVYLWVTRGSAGSPNK